VLTHELLTEREIYCKLVSFSRRMAHCLQKDLKELMAFYNFPAQHWWSLKTTTPIESTYANP